MKTSKIGRSSEKPIPKGFLMIKHVFRKKEIDELAIWKRISDRNSEYEINTIVLFKMYYIELKLLNEHKFK